MEHVFQRLLAGAFRSVRPARARLRRGRGLAALARTLGIVLTGLLAVGASARAVTSTTAIGVESLGSWRDAARSSVGFLAVEVTDADGGGSLAARIQLRRQGWLSGRRVIVEASGGVRLRLEPGRYALIASHGPEWSVARRELIVRSAERQVLRIALRREVDASAYSGCDLHVHTAASRDGRASLSERAQSVAAEDLQVAIITDHNRATDSATLRKPPGTLLMSGVEVTTWAPEFGHFNVFPSDRAPRYKRSSPEQLLKEVRSAAGRFVQVNHPRLMQHIGYFALANATDPASTARAMAKGFDGLEVWNGYDLERRAERDEVLQDWLRLIARGQRVVATGGSDSHDLSKHVVGYPRTYVQVARAGLHDPGEVVAALKRGQAFVSNGPIITLDIDGKGPGQTLSNLGVASVVHAHVRVDAPAWMDLQTLELWVDGVKRMERPVDPWPQRVQKSPAVPRGQWTIEVPASHARSVIALVRGRRPMRELFDHLDVVPFAFTNPVWLQPS